VVVTVVDGAGAGVVCCCVVVCSVEVVRVTGAGELQALANAAAASSAAAGSQRPEFVANINLVAFIVLAPFLVAAGAGAYSVVVLVVFDQVEVVEAAGAG
jgi:hypothetical protein